MLLVTSDGLQKLISWWPLATMSSSDTLRIQQLQMLRAAQVGCCMVV